MSPKHSYVRTMNSLMLWLLSGYRIGLLRFSVSNLNPSCFGFNLEEKKGTLQQNGKLFPFIFNGNWARWHCCMSYIHLNKL